MSSMPICNARRAIALCLTTVSFGVFPACALAYVGPGAGLSIIGSVLALFAAVVVAIFGFLFFPIRRLLRRRKQKAMQKQAAESPATPADGPESADRPARERHPPGA